MSEVADNQKHPAPADPPGPHGHWLWGTMREFRRDTLGTLTDWVGRYGDAIRFRYFWRTYAYLFCHPQHNQHILQQNHRNYTKLPNPINSLLLPIVGYSLVTSDGERWQKLRRLVEPAFHQRHIAAFGATMTEAAAARLEQWRPLARAGTALDVAEEMAVLTLEIAGKTLFSMDLTREAQMVGTAFTTVNRHFREFTYHPFGLYLVKLDWLPATRRFKRNIARLDDVVQQIIAQCRALSADSRATLTFLLARALATALATISPWPKPLWCWR